MTQREQTTDVLVVGGDLPALLLAFRLAKQGYSVLVLTKKIGDGAFGRGPGIFSAHYGLEAHEREQRYGYEFARDLLSYRQRVLDELDQELSTLWHPHTWTQASGHMVAHDPYSMLTLRNAHEALNRHGGLRRWHAIEQDKHVHGDARLASHHSDDRVCEPGSLCGALVQAIQDLGGTVRDGLTDVTYQEEEQGVSVHLNGDVFRSQAACVFSLPKQQVWETLVETTPDVHGETGDSNWYHNSFPLFDYAKRLPDGRWVLGSRRSWSVNEKAQYRSMRQGLLAHSHLAPVREWKRPLVVLDKEALPRVQRKGTMIEIEGTGQEDPLMDLLAVDRAVRTMLGQPLIFEHLWNTLPKAAFRKSFLSHLGLQAMLDDRLAQDTRARARR